MWFTIHLDREIHNKNFKHESEQQQNVGIGFAKVCYMSMRQKKEAKKRKKLLRHFRAALSFRADIANARTNSSSSTGNVRKYSDRHIKGNFLIVLPLISTVYIDRIFVFDKDS